MKNNQSQSSSDRFLNFLDLLKSSWLLITACVTVIASLIFLLIFLPVQNARANENTRRNSGDTADSTDGINDGSSRPFADGPSGAVLPEFSDSTVIINTVEKTGAGISSQRAAFMDVSAGQIIASFHADEQMYPASMTKVMTLIVVAEHLTSKASLNDKITVTQSIYDEMYAAGSSGMGLKAGDVVTVEGLMYMLVHRSDGIAAEQLAQYVAGNRTAFAELMNQKAAEMGLVNTHFTNPTGLFDASHYSCCRDIAAIMSYAMSMSLCREILSSKSFVTFITHKSGEREKYTVYNNLTVTLLEEKYPGYAPKSATVIAGKTGYVDESGYCLVSYAKGKDGREYVCVTSRAVGQYPGCLSDHAYIYDHYQK